MDNIVEARSIYKRYGDVIALDHVDITIEKGRIIGLIGPNGAGKTTLLKCLLGIAPCEGEIKVLGINPEGNRTRLLEEVSFIADTAILPMAEVETAYYLRLEAEDSPGVLAEVTHILGEAGISIEAIIQKEQAPEAAYVPVIMLTHVVKEGKMNQAIRSIEALDSIGGSVTRIRVEYLNRQ